MNIQKTVSIGVDVGGTDIKCAIVDLQGKILHRVQRPSQSQKNNEIILQNILRVVSQAQKWAKSKKYKVLGIGFGIPGIVSYEGIVFQSPHFPSWVNYPILKNLSSNLSLPVKVDNDANMAALGEGWIGAGKKLKNFIFMTLGTGIGGGIVINEKVFRGDSGFAGEIGHLVIQKDGYFCTCGGQGCLELYASATGLYKMSPFQPKKLFQMAQKGDRKVRKIFDCFGENLGAGIASVVNLLDIENILIGGGLSGAWPMFVKGLNRGIRKHIYPASAERIRISKAQLGNDAGIIGAAKSTLRLSSLKAGVF